MKICVRKQWLSFGGDCEPVLKYLACKSYSSGWGPIKFLDALFRGYGQVVFANNPISGALIFIALTIANPLVSAAGLLTSCVALLTSILIVPQHHDIVGQGLTVYNALLVGLVTTGTLPSHYGHELEAWHWPILALAAVLSVYIGSALKNILGSISRYPLPYLTIPFNIVQYLLFLSIISIYNHNNLTTVPDSLFVHNGHPILRSTPILTSFEVPNDYEDATSISAIILAKRERKHSISSYENDDITEPSFIDLNEDLELDGANLNTSELLITKFNNSHSLQPMDLEYVSEDKQNKTTESGTLIKHIKGIIQNFTDTELNRSIPEVLAPVRFRSTEEDGRNITREKADDMSETSSRPSDSISRQFPYKSSTNNESTPKNMEATEMDVGLVVKEGADSSMTFTEGVEKTSLNLIDFISGTEKENKLYRDDKDDKGRKQRSPETTTMNISPHSHLANVNSSAVHLDWGGVFSGVVLSMSQVYGCTYAPTALLIYLAVVIYSPIMAAFGVLGAFLGTVTGVWLTNADTYAAAGGIYDGSWGFNGLLCTMSLGGLFFVITWPAALIAVLSAFFSGVIQRVLIHPFAEADLTPMSLPFNLSALLFLCVTSTGALVRPEVISFPEKHCQEYRKGLIPQNIQEHASSSSDVNDKDSEVEKKLPLDEVV